MSLISSLAEDAFQNCKTVNNNYCWPQTFLVSACLITTIALSVLAIQGTLDPMIWAYGMAAVLGLSLIMNIVNLCQPRDEYSAAEETMRKRQMCFQIFMCALEATLVGLAMYGLIPMAPAATTLIALNAFAGVFCCTSCSTLLKCLEPQEEPNE